MNITDYDEINFIFATICALSGWFFGRADGLLYALLAFSCIDYVSGIIAAAIHKQLSSDIGFRGIAKKCMIFILVGIAHVVDKNFLGGTAVLRDAIILFYCANEGMSILENADAIGISIPQKLREMFLQMKDKQRDEKPKNKK